MGKISQAVSVLIGVAGTLSAVYLSFFWLSSSTRETALSGRSVVLTFIVVALLIVSWSPVVIRKSQALGEKQLLWRDFASAMVVAVLVAMTILTPFRVIFLFVLSVYLVLLVVDLISYFTAQAGLRSR